MCSTGDVLKLIPHWSGHSSTARRKLASSLSRIAAAARSIAATSTNVSFAGCYTTAGEEGRSSAEARPRRPWRPLPSPAGRQNMARPSADVSWLLRPHAKIYPAAAGQSQLHAEVPLIVLVRLPAATDLGLEIGLLDTLLAHHLADPLRLGRWQVSDCPALDLDLDRVRVIAVRGIECDDGRDLEGLAVALVASRHLGQRVLIVAFTDHVRREGLEICNDAPAACAGRALAAARGEEAGGADLSLPPNSALRNHFSKSSWLSGHSSASVMPIASRLARSGAPLAGNPFSPCHSRIARADPLPQTPSGVPVSKPAALSMVWIAR